jgi:hypothetical protein
MKVQPSMKILALAPPALRLAVELRREIDRLAAKEGVTRSEMFRVLLERGIKATRS